LNSFALLMLDSRSRF